MVPGRRDARGFCQISAQFRGLLTCDGRPECCWRRWARRTRTANPALLDAVGIEFFRRERRPARLRIRATATQRTHDADALQHPRSPRASRRGRRGARSATNYLSRRPAPPGTHVRGGGALWPPTELSGRIPVRRSEAARTTRERAATPTSAPQDGPHGVRGRCPGAAAGGWRGARWLCARSARSTARRGLRLPRRRAKWPLPYPSAPGPRLRRAAPHPAPRARLSGLRLPRTGSEWACGSRSLARQDGEP